MSTGVLPLAVDALDLTVPNELVHKVAPAEVLLTDVVHLAGDRFVVAARWPVGHGLYHPAQHGMSDPMLLVETLRQTAVYLSHRFYGVPLDHPFIFCDLGYEVKDPTAFRTRPFGPQVVLDLTLSSTTRPTASKVGMRLEATVSVDGRTCGRGSVSWQAVDRSRYTVIRDRARGAGRSGAAAAGRDGVTTPGIGAAARLLTAAEAGRRRDADVLLADLGTGARGAWLLHVDQTHPVFFDHPLDHVPGMLLLEAFRQATGCAAGRATGRTVDELAMVGGRTAFTAFCELDAPTFLAVAPVATAAVAGAATGAGADLERWSFEVAAVQYGRVVATGEMAWTVPAPVESAPGAAREVVECV
ncbi:ScbA/BarX family gamma-butyrolactone biosynthesis protein [Kitasatospora camelliae]|uniref:ScbA/BarX family gamma-butyrolactone biosynthesis protein n=1 Tax=Kitasatospora camelliae TaxID=3156397 RepID=A0AAU8K0I7_9ACTN